MSALRIGGRSLISLLESTARPLPVVSRVIQPSVCGLISQAPHLNVPSGSNNFHTCVVVQSNILPSTPKKWPRYNDIVYPPRGPEEPRRPAEVFHSRLDIKYSYKKLWYIANMIRGISVDEAKKQLSFMKRAGSEMVKEVLEEAQDLAVSEHNVEYRSNLWVAESFVGRAKIIKGLRKHAGLRFGTVHYRYTHYFVCLREGPPPKHYETPVEKTGHEYMEDYIAELRARNIRNSL